MKNQFQAFFLSFLLLTSSTVKAHPSHHSKSSNNSESPLIEGIENSRKETSTIPKQKPISFSSKSKGIAPGKSCKNKPNGCDVNLGCSTEKDYTCQDCPYKLGLFRLPDTGKTIKLPNRNCHMSDHCCPNEYCLIVSLGTCKPCKWDTGPTNTKDKTTKCKRDYECCSGLCKADTDGGDKYCRPCLLIGLQCSEDRDCCSRNCNGTCTDGPVFRCKHLLMSCSSEEKCCSELLCKSGVCTEPPEEKPVCREFNESCKQGQECCTPYVCKSGSCQENCNSEGFDCKSTNCCSPFICNNKKICVKPKTCLNKNEACKNETLPCCSGLNCYPDSNGSNYTCQSTPPCMNELVSCDGDEEKSGKQICCSKSNLRCFGGKCRICNKPNIPCNDAKDCCGVLQCIDDPRAGKVCLNCNIGADCNNNGKPCCPGLDIVCLNYKCVKCSNEGTNCKLKTDCCDPLDCLISKSGAKKCLKQSDCSIEGKSCAATNDCCPGLNLSCFEKSCRKCGLPEDDCTTRPCCDDANYECKPSGVGGKICKEIPKCGKLNDKCSGDSCCPPFQCLPPDADGPEICRREVKCITPAMVGCENWMKRGLFCCDSFFCIDGKCTSCVPKTKPCDYDESCCGKLCENAVCVDCLPETSKCNTTLGDPRSKCCSPLRCLGKSCSKCFEDNQSCKADIECCSNYCYWDDMGKEPVCKPKNPTPCIKIEGECGKSRFTKLPERECCKDAGRCLNGICTDCLESGFPCGKDSKSCCKPYSCTYDSTGAKKCKAGEDNCVQPPGYCEIEGSMPKCCPNSKCKNKKCIECLSIGAKNCVTDDDCCTGKCSLDSLGKLKICKNKEDSDCIAITGSCKADSDCCDNPTIKCSHSHCTECIALSSPCSKDSKKPCCDGICGYNDNGEQVCIGNSQCVKVENRPCEIAKDAFSKLKEPICCPEFTCFNNKCLKCRISGPCKSPEDCCERNCNWESDGLATSCSPIKCLPESANCDPVAKSPAKNCCGKCYDTGNGRICKDKCKDDKEKCVKNEECCSAICDFDEQNIKKCLKSRIECVKIGAVCLANQLPCCPEFTCYNGKCVTKCLLPKSICTADKECCSGICFYDPNGLDPARCQEPPNSRCIALNGACLKDTPTGTIPKTCCSTPDMICYRGICKERCLEDDVECSESQYNTCCVGKCSQQGNGKWICSHNGSCISTEFIPCDMMKPGHCCSPFICYNSVCRKCVKEDFPCKDHPDCCSENCFYNQGGTARMCREPGIDCLKLDAQCENQKEGQPLKKCCPGFTCYSVTHLCKPTCSQDKAVCVSNKECCSGKCATQDDGSKKCDSDDHCATTEGVSCLDTGDFPKCCPELKCISGKCKKCLEFPNHCIKSNDECCNKNCYWDDNGTQLICRDDALRCLPVDAVCGTEDVPLKECCKPNLCFGGKCRRCTILLNAFCTSDSECCEGKCLNDSQGRKVCIKEEACIDNSKTVCVKKGENGQKCCENLVCYAGVCLNCSIDECNKNEDCCTKFCGWDKLGNILKCTINHDDCIDVNGSCDFSEDVLVGEPQSKKKMRRCCKGFCVNSICLDCLPNHTACTSHGQCCDGYCDEATRVCKVKPTCSELGESCKELYCCDGSCNEETKKCETCKEFRFNCTSHKECCSKHCHYFKTSGIRTCDKPTTPFTPIDPIDPNNPIKPDVPEPIRCRYFKETCDEKIGLKCCPGYVCDKDLHKCMFKGDTRCSTISEPCARLEDCCPKLKCLALVCQPENAPENCKPNESKCSENEECCELRCKHGLCKPCEPEVPKRPNEPNGPPGEYTIGCSHYKEECDNREIKCCPELFCSKSDGDVMGECQYRKKEIKCADLDSECHLNLCCCEGLECRDGVCKVKKDPGNCGKDDDLCQEDSDCCENMNCFFDSTGVIKRCTPRSKPICIEKAGYCDNLERLCCYGPCIRNTCRGQCQELDLNCCYNEDCCGEMVCVNDICSPKECYGLGEVCNSRKPCCLHLQCDPNHKICIPEPCETSRETGDIIAKIQDDEGKPLSDNQKMIRKEASRVLKDEQNVLLSKIPKSQNDLKKLRFMKLKNHHRASNLIQKNLESETQSNIKHELSSKDIDSNKMDDKGFLGINRLKEEEGIGLANQLKLHKKRKLKK